MWKPPLAEQYKGIYQFEVQKNCTTVPSALYIEKQRVWKSGSKVVSTRQWQNWSPSGAFSRNETGSIGKNSVSWTKQFMVNSCLGEVAVFNLEELMNSDIHIKE